jgi:adenine phosphoribosyltransferase
MTLNLEPYIRDVVDFPQKGIVFKDITPLLGDPAAFSLTLDHLAERYADQELDKIVGIESRGFIFGAALADRLNVGFVPARKPGKLPAETIAESYQLEYGEATLELHCDAFAKGARILLIDDLLATGGTLCAAVRLIERLGGQLAEIAVIIELAFLNGREQLPAGASLYSIMKVD